MEKCDPQYFEEILDTYGEEIKRLIYTYTHDWGTTEDLTQEVFIAVYQHFPSFRGNSSIRTWIYSIAMNKCKDYTKSWHYRKMRVQNKWFSRDQATLKTPETTTTQAETRKEMLQLINQLPIKYREVILLFFYAELSVEEIHLILKIPQSTVKTRLRRAKDRLAKLMKGEGQDV